MTRLLVVDDVPLFRAGLSSALKEAGFDVVGEAGDADEAVAQTEILQPDMVLLDVLMPGLSGLDVVGKIVATSEDSQVILLTGSESEEDMISAIKSGARGYIVKDMPFAHLVDLIQAVAEGGAAFSPKGSASQFTPTFFHASRTTNFPHTTPIDPVRVPG